MAQTDYKSTELGVVDLYRVDSSAEFPLGSITQGKSATYGSAEFIYLKGVASTVEGSFVAYDEVGVTELLTATSIGGVAVALAAVVADKYGWYCVSGKVAGKVAAAFADGGLVYATATAGTADDAVVAGDRVRGAHGRSAIDTPATGLAWIQLIGRPAIDQTDA